MYTDSMLSIARRAFHLQQEQGCGHIRKTIMFDDREAGGAAHTQAIGLRILTHHDAAQEDGSDSSNIHHILLKRPAFTRASPSAASAAAAAVNSSLGGNSTSRDEHSCFLKYCCLCKALLRQDRDIYMYRGDQGFCSVDCRNKQIVSDEMAEIGQRNKTRRRLIVSAPQECHAEGQYCSETCKLLQDMRQRRKKNHRLLVSQTNLSPLVPLVHSLFL